MVGTCSFGTTTIWPSAAGSSAPKRKSVLGVNPDAIARTSRMALASLVPTRYFWAYPSRP
jgi:hypothetical protein